MGFRGTDRTPAYFETFDLPTRAENGGEPSGSEAYYAFDHGNVHVVVLDSTTGLGRGAAPQLEWLERDLAATAQQWIVATFHHPPMSRGTHDGDDERSMQRVREQLVPVLDAAGVDLVLAGHSHNYERSELIEGPLPPAADWARARVRPAGPGGFEKGGGRSPGTVYVVTGNAGQTGPGPLDHPGMVVASDRPGSLVVDVEGCALRATAIGIDGEPLDRFTIRKGAPCIDAAEAP